MKKKGFNIQDIYLKNPILSILLVSMLLTLPWIGLSDFYTKGEPREASLALSMINDGNWILPMSYADEIGYKPPFLHWFIAGFSLITGKVSEASSRLPSALGLIGITFFSLIFFLKRKSKPEAVLAALILLTGFEMHRNGIEGRVDMLLAFFMSMALIEMYKWEEKGLKSFPVLLVVFLGCASLVKGPVGILLPCLVFGFYLLILKYSFWKAFLKNVLIALPALLILLIWYFLAWQQDGNQFLNIVYAENFGRFLGMDRDSLGINYDLGHNGPFWYYIPAILLGFFPWSFVLIFAAFAFGYKKWWSNQQKQVVPWFQRFASMDKLTLYCMIVIVIFLCFYAIPSSKRSVYIMPVYPFASFLLARVFLWAEKSKPTIIRILSYIVLILSAFLLLFTGLAHFINFSDLSAMFISDPKAVYDIGLFADAFMHPGWIGYTLWLFLLLVFILFLGWMQAKNVRVLIFGIFSLFMGLQVFMEGYVFPVYKNGYSFRPYSLELKSTYNLENKMYVMNNLRYYRNFYGLNFYLNNHFKNFEKELPSDGFLILGKKSLPQVQNKYKGHYTFEVLSQTRRPYNELNDDILICKISKL